MLDALMHCIFPPSVYTCSLTHLVLVIIALQWVFSRHSSALTAQAVGDQVIIVP